MNIDRREMLSVCAVLPFVGFYFDNPKTVQFSQYIGPGKNNVIDPAWADRIFEKFKAKKIDEFNNGVRTRSIDLSRHPCKTKRQVVEGCYLSKEHVEWFSSCLAKDYIWYGNVDLVKDTMHFVDGRVKTDYYLDCSDSATILRLADVCDRPTKRLF